jgi:two-component system, NarL family, nitrate/nitrite response regulator NarL
LVQRSDRYCGGGDVSPDPGRASVRVYLVSATRLYREGLCDALSSRYEVVGAAASPDTALADIVASRPDVVLMDGDAPDSAAAVAAVVSAVPTARVVALAMPEVETRLVALAEAGIAGYVSRDGSLQDLVAVVDSVFRGEMLCSPRMAATLLRRVKTLATERRPELSRGHLTERQSEIVALLAEGLTNKEIASQLHIELPTVKNHLHSIFARLDVSRRSEAAAVAREQGLALAYGRSTSTRRGAA